jgi:hypothetical protein
VAFLERMMQLHTYGFVFYYWVAMLAPNFGYLCGMYLVLWLVKKWGFEIPFKYFRGRSK